MVGMWTVLGFLVAILLIFIANDMTHVYVPDEYESPITYRFYSFLLQFFSLVAKILGSLNIIPEPVTMRRLFRAVKDNHDFVPKDHIKVTNVKIENVGVRIYAPNSKSNQQTNSKNPALIFFHGGIFALGSLDSCDIFLHSLADQLNFKVFSVDYTLAPDNAHPDIVEDCRRVTDYIIANSNAYEIDSSNIGLIGDSAGGNIVAILTQHYSRQSAFQPRVQVLVYPWVQFYNLQLPSARAYFPKGALVKLSFSLGKYICWLLGEPKPTNEMLKLFDTNSHTSLINDEKLRAKLNKYTSLDLVPSKYKLNRFYSYTNDSRQQTVQSANIDANFKSKVVSLFDKKISPGLADDDVVAKQPQTYLVILEWDTLKDEGLIYAERLRRNGVDTHVAFYENIYHGIINYGNDKKTQLIVKDLVDYLKQKMSSSS